MTDASLSLGGTRVVVIGAAGRVVDLRDEAGTGIVAWTRSYTNLL